MACFDGFGQVWDGRPFWVGDFSGQGKSEMLFYFPGDGNWWLGTHDGNDLVWDFVGNTNGFGQVGDGRPFWVGDFSGQGKIEMLFYFPGDGNWWLGTHDGNDLVWDFVGNTNGFGQVWDGRPFWVGDFSGQGKSEMLFYFPGDGNWWLGTHDGNDLVWDFVGNTNGFGQVWDGRPFWVGDFSGQGKSEMLFYFPGDGNWWLGTHDGNDLVWDFVGNTNGFGQVWDGRPFWVGDFSGQGKSEMLFYFPGDGNWWLGTHDGNDLVWDFVGNTNGFGQVGDGRPFWVGDFSGQGKSEMLFYFPGDGNWWLGTHDGNDLVWDFVGNTNGFGQVGDGRPFWVGDFSGQGKSEMLFYFPGDGNWWLGTHDGNDLVWDFVGNTGHPHNSVVRIHIKILAAPTNFTIDQMVDGMRDVYRSIGIMVVVGSTENLNLTDIDIETGACVLGQTTQEQRDLFDNRNNVGQNDIAVYVARTVTSNGNALNGCAAHDGRPSCVVARAATRWTLAHEVGHVLDLVHVNDNDRLMTGNGTANITNPPPDLIESERQTMENSAQTQAC